MAILGPHSLLDIAVPTGVDATTLMRLSMQEGLSLPEVLQFAATEIGAENEALVGQYGGLVTLTERAYARVRQGTSSRTMTPEDAEFTNADAVRSSNIGHMFPLRDYKDAVGWSEKWLAKAPREDIRDDITLIRERWRNRVDFDVITRMLTNTENAVGSAGYDVGWAIGTGTNVNFIPPAWRGNQFTSSHTHYIRTNAALDASSAATTLTAAAKELAHHGHSGRKVALVSQADVDVYIAMTDKRFTSFVPSEFQTITGGSNPLTIAQGELQGIPGEVFGYFNTLHGVVQLRYHERIPTGYLWMGKSYGTNNSLNPLAIRTDLASVGGGFGLTINPQVDSSLLPRLTQVNFLASHGVGVNDRTNGVAAQIASGGTTYANPTIS